MNKLTTSILRDLYTSNPDKNWVFSPASYLYAMSILAECIRGKNLFELLAVDPDIKNQNADGIETNNYLLHSADVLAAIEQSILDIVRSHGTEILSFDGPQVISLVNSLVREKTHGKIDNLLSESDYNDDLKFVILNCVYFKKEWQYYFDNPNFQSPEPFRGLNNETQVKYLKTKKWLRYYEDDLVDIVEIPYQQDAGKYTGPEIACYVLVPKTYGLFNPFNKIEETFDKMNRVDNKLEVHLTVPPFETESTFSLKKLTQDAGVTSIFEPSQDWSLVNWTKTDLVGLAVAFIKQKAYLKFGRNGTEAAAATAIGISGCCSGYSPRFVEPPPVKYIRADKPFMYAIARIGEADKPLFVGVVNEAVSI